MASDVPENTLISKKFLEWRKWSAKSIQIANTMLNGQMSKESDANDKFFRGVIFGIEKYHLFKLKLKKMKRK